MCYGAAFSEAEMSLILMISAQLSISKHEFTVCIHGGFDEDCILRCEPPSNIWSPLFYTAKIDFDEETQFE